MPNCSNCSSSSAEYHLCNKCYHNVFKSLYCDGHCGRKCDPSQRTGSNIIALPWWWYCNTCRQKRENPALPPDVKRVMTEDEIDKLQKKLKKLEEENQQYLEKNKQYLEQNTKLSEEKAKLSEEKDTLSKEKDNLTKERDTLTKKNDKLSIQTEAFSGQYHGQRKELEKFYDIIVDVDSLRHITTGWKVKMTEPGKKNYEIMKEKEVLTVGVVGNRNRGKSFVLSKLSGARLPDGTSIKTEGISIKYPEMSDNKEAKYILMDSAGFENALLESDEFKNDDKMSKEEAKKQLKLVASDKTLTEYFIQNFIIQKSNILVLVIGILNYPEQKLLNRIKTENEMKFKNQTPPPFFVVHNLQTFSLKQQVEDYIEETLLHSATFKLEKKESVKRKNKNNEDINNLYFIEKFNDPKDKNIVIYHLIMAMHGTEAGDYYNDFAYEFLSNQFDSFPIHHKFPIIEDVKNQFIENSSKLLENPIKSQEEFEKPKEGEEEIIKLKLEKDKKLEFKRCLIDELGFSNFYGAYFEPKYAYFKTSVNEKAYLCVQLEVPGECKMKRFQADVFEGNWIIEIQGEKLLKANNEKDKNEKNENDDIMLGNREKGSFLLNIKLKAEDYPLAEKAPDRTMTIKDKGLLSYFLKLVEEKKNEELEL